MQTLDISVVSAFYCQTRGTGFAPDLRDFQPSLLPSGVNKMSTKEGGWSLALDIVRQLWEGGGFAF